MAAERKRRDRTEPAEGRPARRQPPPRVAAAAGAADPVAHPAHPVAEQKQEPPERLVNAITVHMLVKNSVDNDVFHNRNRWRFTVRLPQDENMTWCAWIKAQCDSRFALVPDFSVKLIDWLRFCAHNTTWDRRTKDGLNHNCHPHIEKEGLHLDDIKSAVKLLNISTHRIGLTFKKYPIWVSSPRSYVVIVDHTARKGIGTQRDPPLEVAGTLEGIARAGPGAPPPLPVPVPGPPAAARQNISSRQQTELRQQARDVYDPGVPYVGDLHGAAEVAAFSRLNQELLSHRELAISDTHGRERAQQLLLGLATELKDDELLRTMYPSPTAIQYLLNDRAAAVCCIRAGDKHGCGFLISPVLLMTCFHCIYDAHHRDEHNHFTLLAQEFTCDFSDGVDLARLPAVEAAPIGNVDRITFTAADIVYPSDHHRRTTVGFDVAIIRLGNCGRPHIPLFTADTVRPRFIDTSRLRRQVQQQAHLIHYPRVEWPPGCDTTHISRTVNFYHTTNIIGFGHWEFFHLAPTTPGSSGGPILSPTGQLLGMHRRSGSAHVVHSQQRKGAALAAQAFFNAALRIDLFLRDAGFGFSQIVNSSSIQLYERPLQDVCIPAMRDELLGVYVLGDTVAVLPVAARDANAAGHDNLCAHCLMKESALSGEARTLVACETCVRQWCNQCRPVDAGEPDAHFICANLYVMCTDRTEAATVL